MAHHPRQRVLLIFSSTIIMVAAAVYFINERRGLWRAAETTTQHVASAAPVVTEATPEATPENSGAEHAAGNETAGGDTAGSDTTGSDIAASSPTPFGGDPFVNPTPGNTPPPAAVVIPQASGFAGSGGSLLIPVAGVRFEHLQNTYKDSRSGGRVHDAIDIAAPRGTPVLACADGRIVKLFNSERGGITLYHLAPDERTVYYYAHLDRYADGMTEGRQLRRGDVIGYVGDTGNATPGNYHLHFSVALINSPREIHNGTYLNPYDLFK